MRFPYLKTVVATLKTFDHKPASVGGVTMPESSWDFSHAPMGLSRFPPNIEQISVEHAATCSWLVTRRNDIELRFPLTDEDCEHLARLLRERKA
jgi:hypothetical protein